MAEPGHGPKLGRMTEFNPKIDNIRSYFERFENYVDINDVPEEKKLKLFLNVLGAEAYEELKKIVVPHLPSQKTFGEVKQLLEGHFSPAHSIIAERCKFNRRMQHENEGVKDFITELKHLARDCNFGTFLNDALRDRLVAGLRDEETQRALFAQADLTFELACKTALEKELAAQQAKQMHEFDGKPHSVNAVRGERHRDKGKESGAVSRSKDKQDEELRSACWHCGKRHRAEKCWYRNHTCRNCNKKGHLQAVCKKGAKTKAVRYVDTTDDESEELSCHTVFYSGKHSRGYSVDLKIEGKTVSMIIDTGAAVTIVPERVYRQYFPHVKCVETNVSLRTYTGEKLKVLGKAKVLVDHEGSEITLPVVIAQENGTLMPALLGRDWLEKLKINWKAVYSMSADRSLDQRVDALRKKYPQVFKSAPGIVKNYEARIYVKEGAQPVFSKARPIPFAMKEEVAKELEKLEQSGILKRVTKSDWATPLVVVAKKGGAGLRLCGDYKVTVNPVLKTDHYPLPLPEDLYSMLAGGKIFCVLDLSQAYQQVPLAEESKALLTVNTHLGLFQFQRLPYGIASAPAIFQSLMDEVLKGIPKVGCYIDDVIVVGDNIDDCQQTVEKVLERLAKHNITVKEQKCEFFKQSVVYLGHKVTTDGIFPTATKIKAITEAPQPSNVTELRAFLGLLNFYAKFIKDLATVAAPMYDLLKKDKSWVWTDACSRSFVESKQRLIDSEVLTFYDVKKPIGLSCDSSAYGLGAVIFHVMPDGSERPIAFASRTLNAAERNYAQGEKEALAIIFGLSRFHRYLYGRKFTLYTDHQPLLGILASDKPIPSLAAARIQRWAITLAAYQYTLRHRNGKNMEVADALSRLPLPVKHKDDTKECLAVFDSTPLTASQVAGATKRDRILSKVVQFTLSGWPAHYDDQLQPFYVRRNELSYEQGCVTWGQRVIIPDELKNAVLALLHEEHPGMQRMKMLARSFVWWPLIDKDIEAIVRQCKVCQTTLPAKAPGPLHPWTYPTRVWQRVHVDFAMKDGSNLFLLVDSYSKWIEAKCLRTTTTSKTIDCLKEIFAAYGYPEELVSDNGPQFTSHEFSDFAASHGIRHTRTPPYHASSNGAAERLVQTTKASLLKQVLHDNLTGQHRTLHQRLSDFLLAYRNTPNSVTGRTPAELFLKRQPRVKLSLLKPSFVQDMRSRQNRDATHRNEGRGRDLQMEVGDPVFVKTTRGETLSWEEAVLAQRVSDSTFVVKVGDHFRFVHIDHLRPRWTSGPKTSIHPDVAQEAEPALSASSQQDFTTNLPERETSGESMVSGPTAEQLDDVRLGDATSREQLASQPEAEHSAAQPSNITTATAMASPEEAPLRRSNRTRRPPDRYQASNYEREKKRV